jgi:hypothetical protein
VIYDHQHISSGATFTTLITINHVTTEKASFNSHSSHGYSHDEQLNTVHIPLMVPARTEHALERFLFSSSRFYLSSQAYNLLPELLARLPSKSPARLDIFHARSLAVLQLHNLVSQGVVRSSELDGAAHLELEHLDLSLESGVGCPCGLQGVLGSDELTAVPFELHFESRDIEDSAIGNEWDARISQSG